MTPGFQPRRCDAAVLQGGREVHLGRSNFKNSNQILPVSTQARGDDVAQSWVREVDAT